MDRKKLATAVAEAKRFIKRAKELPDNDTYESFGYTYTRYRPKEQGAIRRASMDLTRALAELRKP